MGPPQGKDYADKDAGREGKIEGKFFPLVEKVAGELTYPGDLAPDHHEQADAGDDESDDQKYLTELREVVHRCVTLHAVPILVTTQAATLSSSSVDGARTTGPDTPERYLPQPW